jgi:GxxExxY protein
MRRSRSTPPWALAFWKALTKPAWHELRTRGLAVRAQVPLPVVYQEFRVELGYRVDLLVDETVVVELKAVAKLLPIHQAQLLSYLKLSEYRVGLLINFHVWHLKDGITRLVNNL